MTILSIHRRDEFHPKGRRGGVGEIDRNHRLDDDKDISPAPNNHARFNELVLPHLGDAYSLARWITGSRADAEDVVQDSCLRAFRAIWSADVNPRRWMLTIVRKTAFTWLRKNRPAALVAVEDFGEVVHSQSAAGAVRMSALARAGTARAASDRHQVLCARASQPRWRRRAGSPFVGR